MLPLIAGVLGLAGLGYTAYRDSQRRYDEQRQLDIANQFSREQLQLQSNALYHGASIRARDLQRAGLHPTLAVGNAAGTGTAHAPPGTAGKMSGEMRTGVILDNILKVAQTRLTNAQTNLSNANALRTGNQIRLDNEEMQYKRDRLDSDNIHRTREGDINWQRAMTDVERYGLDALKYYSHEIHERDQRYEFEQQIHNLEMQRRKLGITTEQLGISMDIMRRQYMGRHGYEMPTDDQLRSELRRANVLPETDDQTNWLVQWIRAGIYYFGKR